MEAPSLPKVDSLSNISPSSTMESLPTNAAAWHLRKRARSAHHLIEVGADGVVRARGGSGLYEEGEAFLGHLGLGEEWGEPLTSFRAVALPASAGSCIEVAAGDLHSLFLCGTGVVYSCGGGWEGPLGHGDEGSLSVPRPIAALQHLRVESIAAGGAHSLAISEGRVLWSWGWGRYGQLGHGDERRQLAPRRVDAIDSVIQVAAGRAHSLALVSDGSVFSFGCNSAGQCGLGADEASVLLPTRVHALANRTVRQLHASADASAALVAGSEASGASAAELYRWGQTDGAHRAPLPELAPRGSVERMASGPL